MRFVCLFYQMFVKSNQGDEETTKINYLTFIGTPVQATNMNDFKRVWSSYSSLRLCMPASVLYVRLITFILLACRLWGRKERVTEWGGKQREEEEQKRRSLQIHPWTFPLPKLQQNLLCHTHTHNLKLSSSSSWMISPSVETQSINHLYCNSDENHCK